MHDQSLCRQELEKLDITLDRHSYAASEFRNLVKLGPLNPILPKQIPKPPIPRREMTKIKPNSYRRCI